MKPRQVFTTYSRERLAPGEGVRFCPKCGSQDPPVKGERQVCSVCGYTHYKNPSPGVVVLIEEGENVLLGKRGTNSFQAGKWCLPGGFIEYDEDFLSAAHREVKEETGLDIELLSILSVVTNYLSPELHTLVVVLHGHRLSGSLSAGDDLESVKWHNLSRSLPEMAFAADRHIIERFAEKSFIGAPLDPGYSRTLKSRG
jgi:NADH pyrophosphatase NudC (nudix superfamily)